MSMTRTRPDDRLANGGNARERSAWAVAERPALEVGLEDVAQDELRRTLTSMVVDCWIERTRTLPPSFGIACFRFRRG